MRFRTGWLISFLTVTVAAVGHEVWAAVDGNPDTRTWTDLTVSNVPWWVTIPATVALAVWLPWHFVARYRRKQR